MSRGARWAILVVLIGLLGGIIYHPVRHFGFLNLDDNQFVYGNPQLEHGLTWQSLSWALHANLDYYSKTAEYWAPLTLLSRILDAQFYGKDAAGAFHVTSVLLHLLNTLLLAAACTALTGRWTRSAAVTLLFLVHPQNIEAVCWLSARKDLLSATFFFVTLCAYAFYVRAQNLAPLRVARPRIHRGPHVKADGRLDPARPAAARFLAAAPLAALGHRPQREPPHHRGKATAADPGNPRLGPGGD